MRRKCSVSVRPCCLKFVAEAVGGSGGGEVDDGVEAVLADAVSTADRPPTKEKEAILPSVI